MRLLPISSGKLANRHLINVEKIARVDLEEYAHEKYRITIVTQDGKNYEYFASENGAIVMEEHTTLTTWLTLPPPQSREEWLPYNDFRWYPKNRK